MSRLPAYISTISACFAGAASAFMVMVVGGLPSHAATDADGHRQADVVFREGAVAQLPNPSLAADDSRLLRVERRLDELSDHLRPEDGLVVDEAWDSPTYMQDARERAEQIWQTGLEQHAAEAVRPGWSAETRAAFEEDLIAAAGELSDTIEVECRSESCLASVEFASYHDATDAFVSLLQHPYRQNCAVSVAAPESAHPSDPYDVQILFDCNPSG